MISKRASSGSATADFDALYMQLVRLLYDKKDRSRAKIAVAEIEKLLPGSPKFAESIRGEEVRSLIAEMHGDLVEAIRSRETEIRKILELHSLSVNTPNWQYVSRQYDFSDVSDRLDLLAILYDKLGELDRAISVLAESKEYCQAHHIDFDGQDILDELLQVRTKRQKKTSSAKKSRTSA